MAVAFTIFIWPTVKFGSALSFWVFWVRLAALLPMAEKFHTPCAL